MNQKRASAGGEIGPNGEHYKAGQFIATTQRPKGIPKKKGSGKRQIEPYVWAKPPLENFVPLHGNLCGMVRWDWGGIYSGKPLECIPMLDSDDPRDVANCKKLMSHYRVSEKTLRTRCDEWNAGVRWLEAGKGLNGKVL